MNNLKKLGLSALAGTLTALSAQAGEVTVTGTAEVTYVQRDGGEVTGNPIGMNKAIGFAGSGELDNGWTVSIAQGTTDAFAFSSASLSIGMGSLGTIIVDGGAGKGIADTITNMVPDAFEEADYGFDTGLRRVGGVLSSHGSVHYQMPAMSGLELFAGYNPFASSAATGDGGTDSNASGGRSYEFGAKYAPEMVPGLAVGGSVGEAENQNAGNKDTDEETWYATYAWGPLSIGYQVADIDNGTTSYDTDIYGVSFNVNDALSVSYQYGETDGYAGGVTAEFTGISAAYNIGPMAIKFTDNSAKKINGSNTDDDDNRELNLSMSF
jgi:outer membrane protein OmpU